MLKKIKNKKSQFFVILDLYSVAFLAAALLLLLLFITITGNRTSAKIDENILGMNYAHFFINNFNNEVIELPNCPELLQKTTRKDFLLWIDANRDYYKENMHSKDQAYYSCIRDFYFYLQERIFFMDENDYLYHIFSKPEYQRHFQIEISFDNFYDSNNESIEFSNLLETTQTIEHQGRQMVIEHKVDFIDLKMTELDFIIPAKNGNIQVDVKYESNLRI
jgi:hypothetical protein